MQFLLVQVVWKEKLNIDEVTMQTEIEKVFVGGSLVSGQ